MKRIILFGLMLAFTGYFSQVEKNDDSIITPPTSNHIYEKVEVMPEYPEGIEKLNEFFKENFKIPNLDRSIKGRVILRFIVEKDGSLSDIKVMRDLGYGTGKEAIRLLKRAGKWKAGLNKGEPVRVYYHLSVPVDIDIRAKQE